jgi:hypothetical protein
MKKAHLPEEDGLEHTDVLVHTPRLFGNPATRFAFAKAMANEGPWLCVAGFLRVCLYRSMVWGE